MIFAGFDFQFPPRVDFPFTLLSTLAIAIRVTVGSIDISMVDADSGDGISIA